MEPVGQPDAPEQPVASIVWTVDEIRLTKAVLHSLSLQVPKVTEKRVRELAVDCLNFPSDWRTLEGGKWDGPFADEAPVGGAIVKSLETILRFTVGRRKVQRRVCIQIRPVVPENGPKQATVLTFYPYDAEA